MVYMLIYDKTNKNILAKVSGSQDFDNYCSYFSTTTKNNLSYIYTNNIPNDYKDYKVINKKLVKMTDQEILELRQYGKILTEEERQLNKLKPTQDEVRKAENTIEILTLIQEVM